MNHTHTLLFIVLLQATSAAAGIFPESWFHSRISPAVGIEIELRASNEESQLAMAKTMQSFLQSNHKIKMKVESPNYKYNPSPHTDYFSLSYRNGLKTYTYRLMPESGDIQNEQLNRVVEFTSPKMDGGESQWNEFIELIKQVGDRHQLVAAPSDATGLHVHVDFQNPSHAEIRLLFRFMTAIEKVILDVVQPKPVRMGHILSIRPLHIALQQSSVRELKNLATLEFLSKSYTMNFFRANAKYGTAEFRMFNATLDPELIRAYVRLARQIVILVRNQPKELAAFLDAHPEEMSWELLDRHLNLGLERILQLKRSPLCKYIF